LAPAAKVHDFHPSIRPNGLYWITDVPSGGLTFSEDGRKATLKLTALVVIDQPRWPAPDAEARRARMDVTVVWIATDEPVTIDDPAKQFRFKGWKATTQAECRVAVPSLRFTWRSGPLATSRAKFGVIGEEANGKYYGA
jgi:hypothetical protein